MEWCLPLGHHAGVPLGQVERDTRRLTWRCGSGFALKGDNRFLSIRHGGYPHPHRPSWTAELVLEPPCSSRSPVGCPKSRHNEDAWLATKKLPVNDCSSCGAETWHAHCQPTVPCSAVVAHAWAVAMTSNPTQRHPSLHCLTRGLTGCVLPGRIHGTSWHYGNANGKHGLTTVNQRSLGIAPDTRLCGPRRRMAPPANSLDMKVDDTWL